jgi:hypothetical protein
MGKDEKAVISTLAFSRELAEKITLSVKKNKAAKADKKQGA